MIARPLIPLMFACLLIASIGCTALDSGTRTMTQMFRPRPYDGPVVPESEEDEWGFVGKEGRAGMDRERDPDRWWQDLVMSPRARQIERNLGID